MESTDNKMINKCKCGLLIVGDNLCMTISSRDGIVLSCKNCKHKQDKKHRDKKRGYVVVHKSYEELFWEKVNKTDSCWLWTGATRSGYGVLRKNRKTVYCHRYVLGLFNRNLPKDMTVDHLCRMKLCVNPDHLEVVTRQENIRRQFQKEPKNERSPM